MDGHSAVIPEVLEEPLLQRAGEINIASGRRWGNRELAVWLRDVHRIDCSHMAVQRCLNRIRRERSDSLKELLREELLGGLVEDWKRLDAVAKDVYHRADLHAADDNPERFLACVGELRKLAQTKIGAVAHVDADEDRAELKGVVHGLAEFLASAFSKPGTPAP